MSLTFGFYNSINGDRVYDAIQVSQIFDGIITDGVYATFMKGMVVKASSNASEVIVQPGRCWFNHTWTYIDADYPVEAPAPEVILDRVDALVIDINQENAFRENKLTWVQGTPASINPERPTLINTVTHHQYPLAYIYRKAGTTMIYAADITNAVGTSECPFVTGVLKGLDIDAWLAQWDDEFHTWENTTKTQFEGWMVNQQAVYNTWFNAIKDQMEGNLDEFEDWFETIQGIIDSEAATHLQQEIDDLNDRLPAGSFIEITTTESQLFNRNVTVSDGVHSKTVQFDAYGNATVESFPYVGLLTITSTDGVRTATESLSTPYYARYNVTLAFWSATVNLVGDSSATAGIVVSVYDSESAIPLTSITLDSQGRGSYTATYPDTYKFRYSYGGQTMEVSLAVTQETTYTVEIHAGFNYQAWLTAGRVSGTFASLDAILANEAALRQLMLVHDSVDYLSTANVNEDVTKIFNNDLAAKWINLSDYALDKFYSVPAIKTVMDTADKYGYGEWCLMPQVPKMTSNTAPYGEASASSVSSSQAAYLAFDGNDSTYWASNVSNSGDIIYKFTKSTVVKQIEIRPRFVNGYACAKDCTLLGSNDGTTYESIDTFVVENSDTLQRFSINNNNSYLYYKVSISSVSGTLNYNGALCTLQFYAWQPKGNVPVMTANTAPYGEVSGSAEYSNYKLYYAFDGNENTKYVTETANGYIQYKFTNPVCVKKFKLTDVETYYIKNGATIKGSNDGSTWETIYTFANKSGNVTNAYYDCSDNDKYFLYYRLTNSSNKDTQIVTLQFYGRSLSVSVPTMTSNTSPFGEVFSRSDSSGYQAYKAFDGNSSTAWADAQYGASAIGGYVGYKFTSPVNVKIVYCNIIGQGYKIQYSDNGINYTDTAMAKQNPISAWFEDLLVANVDYGAHKYWRLITTSAPGSSNNVKTLQFYGKDYSEKEFEVGTTKKWLYDHGVEVVNISTLITGASIATKESDHIHCELAISQVVAAFNDATIDLTSFTLARSKFEPLKALNSGVFAVLSVGTARPANTSWSPTASAMALANDKDSLALDVSAINQSAYVALWNQAKQTAQFDLKELWLE